MNPFYYWDIIEAVYIYTLISLVLLFVALRMTGHLETSYEKNTKRYIQLINQERDAKKYPLTPDQCYEGARS